MFPPRYFDFHDQNKSFFSRAQIQNCSMNQVWTLKFPEVNDAVFFRGAINLRDLRLETSVDYLCECAAILAWQKSVYPSRKRI